MSPPLKYSPAYVGLLISQALAVTCNAFLDIQYGVFAAEVLLWSIAFAVTLWVGWLQQGEVREGGKQWMNRSLIIGALLSVVIFIPMWGFPRAGLYMLAMMQVSYNCVTTTRRHLHMSLLVTLVMVLFAASHYRADWTMLFYLVPYVAAVVFTLVAEQINRKADELREHSLGQQMVGAQSVAIAAATTAILTLGLLIYALTPQLDFLSLMSNFGQPGAISPGDGLVTPGGSGMQNNGGSGASSGGANADADGRGSGSMGDFWSSAGEMRRAAARQGMPEWQRDAINSMADITEGLGKVLQPVMQSLHELWNDFKKWLDKNRDNIILAFIILGVLALLYVLWRLFREAKVATWLHTRYDYLCLVWLRMIDGDGRGAEKCYAAMVRLFELQEIEKGRSENTREYLAELNVYFRHLSPETGEMTRYYEDARYGKGGVADQAERMRELYFRIYKHLAEHY